MNWLRSAAVPLAAAASVLLAIGFAFKFYSGRNAHPAQGGTSVALVEVDGPEKAKGQAVAEISFAAADWVNHSHLDYYASSGVVAMPSNIQLADSTPVTEDQTPLPPF
jgi:hypothetical protein